MKTLLDRYLLKSVAFGAIMTIIGFFTGQTVFTFPPLWLDLLRLFLIYAGSFLAVNLLFGWIGGFAKRKKWRKAIRGICTFFFEKICKNP